MPYVNYDKNYPKLKNGSTIEVKNGQTVWIRGDVEFSRIVTKFTREEIIENNARRKAAAERAGKPAPIEENPDKPFNSLSLKNVSILPASNNMNNLTNEEIFVMDKFYTSTGDPSTLHANFRNITQKNPQVYLKNADGTMSKTPTEIPGELAADVPVMIGVRIYCTQRNPGISLFAVYCIGDVKYRVNKTEQAANNALSALGLAMSTTPVDKSVNVTPVPDAPQPAEAVFGDGMPFDDTGVVPAGVAPAAPVAPVQPQAPAQPQPPISQAQQLLQSYQPNNVPPVQGQGQGYGTGGYNA